MKTKSSKTKNTKTKVAVKDIAPRGNVKGGMGSFGGSAYTGGTGGKLADP